MRLAAVIAAFFCVGSSAVWGVGFVMRVERAGARWQRTLVAVALVLAAVCWAVVAAWPPRDGRSIAAALNAALDLGLAIALIVQRPRPAVEWIP